MCSCKREAHVANYCKNKLIRDYEKNPGPPIYVDPNKAIAAPYSQGNELVFGQNAAQRSVAMSLCSWIYNRTQGIRGPFLKSPGNFSGPKSHRKISNLTITELLCSQIFNMKRSSLHTRSFRCIHFFFFRCR